MKNGRRYRGYVFMALVVVSVIALLISSCAVPPANTEDSKTWWKMLNPGNNQVELRKVVETSDGNYVAVGAADDQILVYKFKKDGEKIWQFLRSGANYTRGWNVIATSDGGIVAVGFKQVAASKKAYAIKLSQDGEVVWEKDYDVGEGLRSELLCAFETSNGYLLMGNAYESIFQAWVGRLLLIFVDKNGEIDDGRVYTFETLHPSNEIFYSGVAVEQGRYLFVGYDDGGNRGVLLVEYSEQAGFKLVYSDEDLAFNPRSMILLEDGSLVIAGGEWEAYVVKLQEYEEGWTKIWTYTYEDPNISSAKFSSVCNTDDDGFLAVGEYTVGEGSPNLLAVKIDSNGDFVWRRLTSFAVAESFSQLYSVVATDDDGFVTVGTIDSEFVEDNKNGNIDGLIIMTDRDGNVDIQNRIVDE